MAKKNRTTYRGGILDVLMAHRKILMPLILVIGVTATVLVALYLNRRAEEAEETIASAPETTESAPDLSLSTMEPSTNEEINALIQRYYEARSAGDAEALDAVVEGMTETSRLYHQELSRFIETYDVQEIYLLPGQDEDSYIAYVVEPFRFYDNETPVPSMESLYIRRSADGAYRVYAGDLDAEVTAAISASNMTADVIDLNNKINAEFNALMENSPELSELMSAVHKSVNDAVASVLAEEANEIAEQQEAEREAQRAEEIANSEYLRAKGVINVRSAATTENDGNIIGQTEEGKAYRRIAIEEGGWSRIEFQEGTEAFVLASEEYFELIPAGQYDPEKENAPKEMTTGEHIMNTLCNIREEMTTDSESLGMTAAGMSVEVLEVMEGGEWCKIEFNGITGYVMTQYID
ncbi:MAG: SH3 domain-containing protein [Lachnospiraceae bacterium]|nr:SH3 domain-containing protein [Lachnospiraceae bacterium]